MPGKVAEPGQHPVEAPLEGVPFLERCVEFLGCVVVLAGEAVGLVLGALELGGRWGGYGRSPVVVCGGQGHLYWCVGLRGGLGGRWHGVLDSPLILPPNRMAEADKSLTVSSGISSGLDCLRVSEGSSTGPETPTGLLPDGYLRCDMSTV